MTDPSDADHFSNYRDIDSLLQSVAGEIRSCLAGLARPVAEAAIEELTARVVVVVRSFTEGQVAHIDELVKIGLALSAEKRLDRLLEMIVSEARRFTNADGGTLYIRDGDSLEFAIAQNETLGVRMGGTGEHITWPSVQLRREDGSENHRNVSAHCVLVGVPINIANVYEAEGFDFQGTKDFDATTGYRSGSMLVIPLRDHEDQVIGVLQLINAMDRASGEVVEFPRSDIDHVTSLASQAAIALTNMRLIGELENLFNAFLRTIADAIDEKSPYTTGHILRVAELAERLAVAVNRAESGRFARVFFSDEELSEIRMAAWMHDIGKIVTPEHVLDKSTKLETVWDRLEAIRYRMEILKRDAEIASLREVLAKYEPDTAATELSRPVARELDREFAFLAAANESGEWLDDESVERIRAIAERELVVGENTIPLLSSDEIVNLTIRRGTLNPEERTIITNHANVTIRMLEALPFPRKMQRVPRYAGMHHERINGTGYPRRLSGEAIPLPARMLAVADVFEALTAADRPYKAGKLLSESMQILERLAAEGHLDSELCDLLVEAGIAADYAAQVLADRQRDAFYWKGRRYTL